MQVLQANLVHSTDEVPLQVLENHVIGVDDGKIVFIEESLEAAKEKQGINDGDVLQLSEREFLMPGFVDTHVHAPQYVNAGTKLDLPLLDWLYKYTFPTEQSFGDPTVAELTYGKIVRRLLKNGTTTACYYATIHLESTIKLCNIVDELGQRAYVGKVNMDSNAPDCYRESTQQSYDDTRTFIDHVSDRQNSRLSAIITPRFAPSTSPALMRSLAQLAAQYDVPIQTHIAENRNECKWVKNLFGECQNYADIYDSHGLLRKSTVLAHGIYLDNDELDTIKQRGSGISHCANSNFSIRSGIFDARNALDLGVNVGLGTDMSAGYSSSMLDAQRVSVLASRALGLQRDSSYRFIDYRESFRLATLGGSKVLGLDNQIGNFCVGKYFDALRIDVDAVDSPFDACPSDDIDDCVSKFLHIGDDRNVKTVYVEGRKISR